MKNKFVLKSKKDKYDIIIVIPTIGKEENIKRVNKILKLIENNPPKKFSYNIYLAYEGRDWNAAVNKAYSQLEDKINEGLIFLDDDSFPTENWMEGFENIVRNLPNSIFQFSLIDRKGICRWNSSIYKLGPLSMALISLFTNRFFIRRYEFSSEKYLAKKVLKKKPVRIHSACYSAIFVPQKLIKKGIRIRYKDEKINYCEDNDFCYNSLMHGFKTYQIPNEVIHLHGLTKQKKDYSKIDKYRYSSLNLYADWFTNKEFIKKLEEEGLIKKDTFKIFLNEIKRILLLPFSQKPLVIK